MLERDPSGAPPDKDTPAKTTGAAPGGSHPQPSAAASVHASSPRRGPLQILLFFIKKRDPGGQSQKDQ
jgi:hypothetical protein